MDAAEAVFAARGFAGARIDEIAARAGMAKSHVYYHFAGKQQIFDALIEHRLAEMLGDKQTLLNEFERGLPEAGQLGRWLSRVFSELLIPRKAFLRIVLVESQTGRGSPGQPPLLRRVLGPVLDDVVTRLEAHRQEGRTDQLRSDLLWFALVPAVLHVLVREDAAVALGLSEERTSELFLHRLAELEGALLTSSEHDAAIGCGGTNG
jgi:AcrR family transcriptional regulator